MNNALDEEPNVMMIDIETLSLTSNAYVTQIGVCVANVRTRRYLYPPTNFWTDNNQPGQIDFDTVAWWMKQDRAVAVSVFEPEAQRTPASEVFLILQNLYVAHKCTVWGSPAMYDLPILTGFFGNRKPWKYNDERDMMTLYKLLDPLGMLAPPTNENAHNAAADAQWQMEYLFKLWDHLHVL